MSSTETVPRIADLSDSDAEINRIGLTSMDVRVNVHGALCEAWPPCSPTPKVLWGSNPLTTSIDAAAALGAHHKVKIMLDQRTNEDGGVWVHAAVGRVAAFDGDGNVARAWTLAVLLAVGLVRE